MGLYRKNPAFTYVFIPGLGRIKDDRIIEGDYDHLYPSLLPATIEIQVVTHPSATLLRISKAEPTVEQTLSKFDGVLQKLADAEAAEKSAVEEVIAPLNLETAQVAADTLFEEMQTPEAKEAAQDAIKAVKEQGSAAFKTEPKKKGRPPAKKE